MPASRSRVPPTSNRARSVASSPPARSGWRGIAIVLGLLLVVLSVVAMFLPAAALRFFMPASVSLEEASGTVWHGSVGRLGVSGHDAGSIEWQLHPASIFAGRIAAQIHWTRGSSTADAALDAAAHSLALRDLHASGALSDWADFNLAPGWNGRYTVDAPRIAIERQAIRELSGVARIDSLTTPQQEGLGSYEAQFQGAADATGAAHAELRDRGGPLQVQGSLTLTSQPALATVSGTVRERTDVPPGVHRLIDNYAALRPRTADGSLPFDFELAF